MAYMGPVVGLRSPRANRERTIRWGGRWGATVPRNEVRLPRWLVILLVSLAGAVAAYG